MMSNASLFRAQAAADHRLLLATLPRCGVVEYDATPILARIKPEDLTGPARRKNLTLLRASMKGN